ncbi:Uncharacterised protein, partial [Mycoplasma putrefaciens]
MVYFKFSIILLVIFSFVNPNLEIIVLPGADSPKRSIANIIPLSPMYLYQDIGVAISIAILIVFLSIIASW